MLTPEPIAFADAGRIPAPGDNVAIAVRTLPAGTHIVIRQLVFELSHTVLEGHRFAIFRIRNGDALLSWGLPFGLATRDIEPGEYICNENILRTLAERRVDFDLPSAANFLDHRLPFELDAANFRPGQQVAAPAPHPTFLGFRRNGRRGAGTRNYIVVLGTNSRTAGLARAVAKQFAGIPRQFPNIDGVVPVDHTEGGSASAPNNLELTLRTLAGFMVNPNVGAVLCLDFGSELLSNAAFKKYLVDHHYPTDDLLHEFLSVTSFESGLARAAQIIESWLPRANGFRREELIEHELADVVEDAGGVGDGGAGDVMQDAGEEFGGFGGQQRVAPELAFIHGVAGSVAIHQAGKPDRDGDAVNLLVAEVKQRFIDRLDAGG